MLILAESRKASWRRWPWLLLLKDVERLTTPMDLMYKLTNQNVDQVRTLAATCPGNQSRICKPASQSACYQSDVLEARMPSLVMH